MTPQQFTEYLDREIAEADKKAGPASANRAYFQGRCIALESAKRAYASIEQPDPWISVDFALPPKDGRGDGLVKIKYKDGTEDNGYRYNGSWRNEKGYYDHGHNPVTHWMPLPAPPSPVNQKS